MRHPDDACLRATGASHPASGTTRPPLCNTCRDAAVRRLRALPAVYDESTQALVPSSASVGERVSGSSTPGIPLNDRAVEARAEARAVLASWAAMVKEDIGAPPLVEPTVHAMSRFLLSHFDWLAGHPTAARDFAEELKTLIARLSSLNGRAPQARRLVMGPCAHRGCDGSLIARPRALSEIRCDKNEEHTWQPRQWAQLRRSLAAAR
ncbi:hypothetical protein ACFU76_36450 [Streptomyces sp. NPDC057539]|uniref:hypothetical protein n=1 Tax=Streptomyces sp. NPDC057539 TaxID=3346159 RepID=UPI0036794C42